jgi:hypothetical protein
VNVRTRQPWESQVISGCIVTVVVVITILAIIMLIYLAMFGAAQLRAHWP